MSFQKDPNECGAIWKKQGKNGEYFSINLNGEWFTAFPTKSKGQSGKGPDYRILKQQPREQAPQKPAEETDDSVPF